MITEKLRNVWSAFFLLAVFALAGCGGGGGGSSSSSPPPTANSIALTLTDPLTGGSVTNIAVGTTATLTATVLGASRRPVANAIVTFTVPSMLTMLPSSGTALTNSSGVASVTVQPASAAVQGADKVSASALAGTVAVSGSLNFSVSLPNVTLSGLTVTPNPLSPYGTASVVVDVLGSSASVPVFLTSGCAISGKASLPASVLSVNGRATATYTDKGCGALDTITASLSNGSTQVQTLTVTPPSAASIQLVSVTPSSIVLKGTGGIGLQETSIVKFRVVDGNNVAIANTNVVLDLTTRVGGILLDGSNAAVSRLTNAAGEVQVSVQSGTVPTAVWVQAQVNVGGRTLATQSTALTISTGLPSQDRFSLSIEKLNIEGLQFDGETTSLNILASDRLGNPAPDGTVINFIANGGQIVPSCTLKSGACSATFTSANPRPSGNTEPVLGVDAGRVTVLAYGLGEESFTDQNGNNVYDFGEPFNDLGNAFIDANQNGVLNAAAGETAIIFGSGTSACLHPITTSPAAPSAANTCDGKWGTAHIRQNTVIVLSGSHANINSVRPVAGYVPNTTFTMGGTCKAGFNFFLFDDNRNPMPEGTTLTAGTPPDKITVTLIGDTVLNSAAPGGTQHGITIEATDTMCVGGAMASAVTIPITVSTPKKRETVISLTIQP